MSTEENKAIVRRFLEEVINQKNLAVVDELLASNYVGHIAGMEDVRGSVELKQALTVLFTAFPDYQDTIEDMVAEGDEVVGRWTSPWTHKGEFMGIAATGKQGATTAIAIFRIEEGKIVEEWEMIDMLGLMQQLGAISTQ